MNGFYIKEIRITGKEVESVSIIFEKGLNVINGPSNTGKSYVFKCINYIFGGEEIKAIPEANKYEDIYLELRKFEDDSSISIMRKIGTNDVYYNKTTIDNFLISKGNKLKVKHSAKKEDNISRFLLKLIGIKENKYLISNARGTKKTLSFRAICNLILINENKIISEDISLIFDNIKTNNTYSKSVFKYLLMQEDNSEDDEIESKEITKAKLQAQIEYIQEEISKLSAERESIDKKLNGENVKDIDNYSGQIIELEELVKNKQQQLIKEKSLQEELVAEYNKQVLLIDKFNLLKEQYANDIKRLEFIDEGEVLLNQIHIKHCPLCNSSLISETFSDEDIEEIVVACTSEIQLTKKNLKELNETLSSVLEEKRNTDEQIQQCEDNINKIINEVEDIYNKGLQPLKQTVDRYIDQQEEIIRDSIIEKEISDKNKRLLSLKEEINSPIVDKIEYNDDISDDVYKELCKKIKLLLIQCGYKKVKDVQFDVKEQDIIIDNVSRRNNGKGYRAFFYSIFIIALMEYLLEKEYAFSRVIVLDSPLTTLSEEEIDKGNIKDGDLIDESLQNQFFITLLEECKNQDRQIIIIDNKEIPDKLVGKCNHIEFTKGKKIGRYGLFPVNKSVKNRV